MQLLFITKKEKCWQKTIVQLVCFLFLEKILKELHIIPLSTNKKPFHIKQSDLLLGDSYINQSLATVNKTQIAFDENPIADMRGSILDI